MKKCTPFIALLITACGGGGQQGVAGPPEGGVVTGREQTVTLSSELPGRTSAFEASDVRPQVNGLILKRLFTEGDQVRAGQAFYQIDPAPYEAQVANARAALVRARSSIAPTAALARRYNDLAQTTTYSPPAAETGVT